MTRNSTGAVLPSSFRDPSGFLFSRNGEICRQVNSAYQENYDHLIQSGLYDKLVEEGLLVAHEEVDSAEALTGDAYRVIKPVKVPFISYPYEWSFSQLKDAALTTIQIEKIALDYDMSLKDCSAYNIQFLSGRPLLIDTLSFEKHRPGEPWIAYRQFCQHFLAPLALMSCRDVRLNQLMRVYIDGVPLDLASALLPFRSRFAWSLLTHIHLHAKSQKHYSDKTANLSRRKIGRIQFLGIIDSLESAVKKLTWRAGRTEWGDYYDKTNYSPPALEHKRELVSQYLDRIAPQSVWDLGGNVGAFSRLASQRGVQTICFDIDPAAVEVNYQKVRQDKEAWLLPLLLDLTNPSPEIGWENLERNSFIGRGPVDAAMGLALIHHLAISNNLPLARIAGFFAKICRWLIIEFIPKEDSQVQRLLATREDIFPHYNQENFEREFERYFLIEASAPIKDSERRLYLMRSKEADL